MPGSCETAEPDLALAPVPPLGERFRETVRREGRPAEKAGDTEGRAAGVAPHDAGTIPGDLARAVALVVEHWGRALRVTLILPAVAWLFLRKQAPANGVASRLVILVASLHFTLLVGLILQFDYADMLSVRHAMILAGLTLPFSGAGIAAVLAGLPERKRVLAGVFIVTGLVAPTLPWMLERRYAHEAYLRRAGEWIRARQPTGARVHTTRHPVAFYANGVHQWSPLDVDIVRILAEARSHHPDWLVFDLQRLLKMSPSFVADLERAARPGELERAHDMKQEVRGRLQTARIYRYHPPS